jgi:nicotinamidase-related amidase
MAHPRILDSNTTALLVVDIQEAFRNVIGDFEKLASRASTAVRAFRILELPIFVTEQYPKGLGPTAEEVRAELAEDFAYLEKSAFSSCGAAALEAGFKTADVRQIVVCGLETHVCVNQTVHDLLDRGFQVHLLTDVVASRSKKDKKAGLAKMFASGAISSSLEMAVFEVMRDARHEKFKEIQRLIK